MGKLIAVWGSPGAGKTMLAVKLAAALHDRAGLCIYTVFADSVTPTLPTVFPTKKVEDMYSMGAALSKAETTQHDIEANTVTVKELPNLGFLGYKDGENQYSYPRMDEIKCADFFLTLKDMSDAILVDCTSVPDTLSKTAMSMADIILRVASPDLKSVAFFSSQLPILAGPEYQQNKHIIVLNENTDNVYAPVYDASHSFVRPVFTLPFCQDICFQSIDGELLAHTGSKKFNNQIGDIVSMILGE